MKKAARDQLPHLESDGTIELGDNKMANRPEREASQESWAGYRFQSENSDVYADEQSCESRHKRANRCIYFHTKVTKDHDGHNVTEIWFTTTTQSSRRKKKEINSLRFWALISGESERVSCVAASVRHLAWLSFVR